MIRVLGLAALLALTSCSKKSNTARPMDPPPGGGGGSTTTSPAGGGGTTTSTTGGGTVTQPLTGGAGDDPCPAIQIKAPDSVPQGSKARVTANLIGGTGNVTLKWSLTAGTIVSGQGTPTIQVDTTGQGGSGISATLDLGGLPRECATTSASATFLVGN